MLKLSMDRIFVIGALGNGIASIGYDVVTWRVPFATISSFIGLIAIVYQPLIVIFGFLALMCLCLTGVIIADTSFLYKPISYSELYENNLLQLCRQLSQNVNRLESSIKGQRVLDPNGCDLLIHSILLSAISFSFLGMRPCISIGLFVLLSIKSPLSLPFRDVLKWMQFMSAASGHALETLELAESFDQGPAVIIDFKAYKMTVTSTVIESQRRWVGLGWTDDLLVSDPPKWANLRGQFVHPPVLVSCSAPGIVFDGWRTGTVFLFSCQ